jgi:hypothetical protein
MLLLMHARARARVDEWERRVGGGGLRDDVGRRTADGRLVSGSRFAFERVSLSLCWPRQVSRAIHTSLPNISE